MISQSLGLEVGGSIGVPLYVSQALAVAMYIFGFRAGWLWIIPEHPAILVDFIVFAVLFVIAFISAGLAFRVQYVILAIIIGSLVSVLVSAFGGGAEGTVFLWGEFPYCVFPVLSHSSGESVVSSRCLSLIRSSGSSRLRSSSRCTRCW